MLKWQKTAAALSTGALLLSMAACSSGGNDNTGDSVPEAKPSASATQKAGGVSENGFPIVQQPIKLKFFAQRAPLNGPFKDMSVFQEYAKKTNIDIEWEDVPAEGFAERKNLLFASNELPDALYKASITPLEAVKYGSSGILVPLEGYIDEYAPNLKELFDEYPAILSSITAPDGHIYALPAVVILASARTDKPWINETWLQKLNLQEPTTTDELVQVLRAFRDDDPNGNGQKDEIPMSELDRASLIASLAGSWGLEFQLGYNINIADGKVDIWLDDPEFKDYLGYLHQLYAEKLIDNQLFTQKPTEFYAKMAGGQIGYFHNQASDAFAERKADFAGIAPLAGPTGIREAWGKPIARDFGTFAITSANKNPEATIRWLDYFFGEEGSIFFRYGTEGKTFNYKSDGLPEYTDDILTDKRGLGATIGQFTAWPGGGAPQLITEKNASAINPPEVQAAQEKLDPYMPKDIYGAPIFDDRTSKEVDTLRQDIDAYVAETTSKFITGALSLDKWDDYVKTLKQMDLSRLESIYQEAYDKSK